MTDTEAKTIVERSLVRCLLADSETGRVLVMRRSDLETFGKGLWELLQGSREAGETPEEAIWREVEEELGVTQDYIEAVSIYTAEMIMVSGDHFAIDKDERTGEDWANINFLLVGDRLEQMDLRMDDSHDAIEWVSVERARELLGDHAYSLAGQRMLADLDGMMGDRIERAARMIHRFQCERG